LNYSLFLRVSFAVPTSPELQTLEEHKALAAFLEPATSAFFAFSLRLGVKSLCGLA
jgi:hypothetical protein